MTKHQRNETIVKTICNMCTNHCGMDVHVQNGKIVKVDKMQEHPLNHLCVKPYATPEIVHSSERLVAPLQKVNGQLREISWDKAFAVIVDKLTDIKEKYGANAVDPVSGFPEFRALLCNVEKA